LRTAVSLLFSEGHHNANRYPIARVWYETQIVNERVNNRIATETTLMHAAMVAVVAPKGAGNKQLQKLLKGLRDGN
jgi:hypothetical protein